MAVSTEDIDADMGPESSTQQQTADPGLAQDQDGSDQQEHDDADTEESTSEDVDYQAEAAKWKALARKHQQRSRGVEALRSEVEDLRAQVAERDTAAADAAGALAAERLHTKLARAGLSEQDAQALIEHLDSSRLLKDGAPSAEAIDAVAASLTRSLGRGRGVDDDQGQHSNEGFSADAWLRRKART